MTTPCGARHFRTAQQAHDHARAESKGQKFVVMRSPEGEFAWVAPVEVFMGRAVRAANAGIDVVSTGGPRDFMRIMGGFGVSPG